MGGFAVREGQLRGLFRLLGEAREVSAAERRRHVLEGLLRLVGGDIGAMVQVVDFEPGGAGRIVDAIDHGWASESDRAVAFAPLVTLGSVSDPALERLMHERRPGATRRRAELVADRDWYRSPTVMDHRRPARIDDAIYSFQRPRAGPTFGLCVNRAWGGRPFTEEDRNLVDLFQSECDWILASSSPASVAGPALSPRQRATLDRLLAGDSEKEAANALGLSVHTVHQHVKALYRAHRVRSRPELLARILGRRGA
jgi:DNA-binding CsgD family transcriptional regulator